jgi:asparagine synthase (glutamine-hydrolysing)
LYQREGESSVNHLEGMFAFAIWDRREKTCFLARDPLGIKPLYLWRHGQSLAFASEIRALLRANLAPSSLCPEALYAYLLYGSVQEPRTLVKQIEMLPAGHTLLWKRGGKPKPYWQLQFGANEVSSTEAAELTRAALDDSIRRHFVSDVPVGVFLSGGIDSTAILTLARAAGFEKLQTFCISFDDPTYDEGNLAAETASYFQTEHHDWRMTAEDGRNLMDGFLKSVDQPSNDGFNTYCVSKLAHDHGMKVVLSGLGGDELFGGYASFQLIPRMTAWRRRLRWIAPSLRLAGRFGERFATQPKLRRAGTFLQSAGSVADAYWAVRGFFTPGEARQLVSLITGQCLDYSQGGSGDSNGTAPPSVADEISFLETTRYMRNQLLRDSDVMSMAWGLELRVPLVDRTLQDAVSQVPAKYRLAFGKRLLLEAVPEIPRWIAGRPKRGFAFPFEQWLSREWREVFQEIATLSPVPLTSWYRRWCLFTLNHFLSENALLSAPELHQRHAGIEMPPATGQLKRLLRQK